MTSTANPDYWALLGLSPDSDQKELKLAFRREARKWHPDLNGNDRNAEERFKLVNEAYAVLSDPRKRKAWEGSNKTREENESPFTEGFPTFEEYLSLVLGSEEQFPLDKEYQIIEEEEDFKQEDDVSNVRDWPAKASPPPPPVQAFQDLETLVSLSPEQGLHGTTVQIELDEGTLIEVDTPPMAGDGWRLRLAGVAPGGRDHFLQLRIQTDEGLRVDGLRILYRLELLPADAVLGCAAEVPTIHGQVTLQVPPGSSSGRLLRLRGRGLEMDGLKGDQLVEIVVVIPSELGDSERALYERLQELSVDPELF
ncbi:DnaJ domain-containing protein [Prochlorococcus sp. MIT 1341]|uniref:DnaJ domain-containing protein n=1 Tax=Prochlorococcus sp. MIT 1341 TaxID=3096221 RepID=UPI002A74B3AE|nr:DnaJ domain-containing protein [Prochlorococcus sp. MIT 1341]